MAQWQFVETAVRNLNLYTYSGYVSVSSHTQDACLSVNIHWMCVCQLTNTGCVSVSSHTLDVSVS